MVKWEYYVAGVKDTYHLSSAEKETTVYTIPLVSGD